MIMMMLMVNSDDEAITVPDKGQADSAFILIQVPLIFRHDQKQRKCIGAFFYCSLFTPHLG